MPVSRVIICGGGVAGTVTALALGQAGIDSAVYEAQPAGADDIGAFLVIMRNGQDALDAVQAGQAVRRHASPAREMTVHLGTGEFRGRRQIGGEGADAVPAWTLTRAALYRALQDELARRGGRIEHGKRLAAATVAPGGGVTARFADGTVAEGDLLVGADGLRSTVRRIIDPAVPSPRYTGLNVVYGYSPAGPFETARYGYRMTYGHRGYFGYTTVPDGRTWWFARLPAGEIPRDELAAMTAGRWRDRALGFFTGDGTPSAAIIRAADEVHGVNAYDLPHVPAWRNGPVVLAGDAAHAASPAAGQGASMAAEDGVTLAGCLRDVPRTEDALAAYERRRRPRAEQLVAASAGQSDTIAQLTAARTLAARSRPPTPWRVPDVRSRALRGRRRRGDRPADPARRGRPDHGHRAGPAGHAAAVHLRPRCR
ncbi:MAG TPA: NAD(P)/FAD-dependent oxidoreductase [Streptosporangiaceae bacterium]